MAMKRSSSAKKNSVEVKTRKGMDKNLQASNRSRTSVNKLSAVKEKDEGGKSKIIKTMRTHFNKKLGWSGEEVKPANF